MGRVEISEWRDKMGDQRIRYQKMGRQGPCFKGFKMPHTKDRKMEGNMVGKDVWKWIDGVKAIVWRKERHVYFLSIYEHFFVVPLVLIMGIGMKVE